MLDVCWHQALSLTSEVQDMCLSTDMLHRLSVVIADSPVNLRQATAGFTGTWPLLLVTVCLCVGACTLECD
jgi:hypothetical protein